MINDGTIAFPASFMSFGEMQSGPEDLLVPLSDLTFSFTDCDEIIISAIGGNTFEISVAFGILFSYIYVAHWLAFRQPTQNVN